MGTKNKRNVNNSVALIALVSLMLSYTSQVYSVTEREQQIIDRIAPVGEVCVEGEDCGGAVAVATSGPAEPRTGDTVYKTACFACHDTGVAGAPKMGDGGAWAPRIEQGMEALIANALNGINAMPPKGTCMDCSDEEIRSVVQYIVDNSQ